MATSNDAAPHEPTPSTALRFSTETNYHLSPGVKNDQDTLEYIGSRLSQLNAMLTVSICDDFDRFNETVKSNYLWSCAVIARECDELVQHVAGLAASSTNSVEAQQ